MITIIILLILATISIQSLTNTGLFSKANEAKEKTRNAEKNQQSILEEYEKVLNENTVEKLTSAMYNIKLSDDNNTILKDANGNIFVIPAGFKMVVNDDTNNATTVDKGIVIEDATSAATAGSQFVWIPVGKIYTDIARTEANAKTIKLGRYDFDGTTGVESAYSGTYVEEDANDASTLTNTQNKAIAKNITNFKNSVSINGGYYIGRYEARTATARTATDNKLTQITEKGTDPVYNFVTQLQAANQAKNMYNSNKFTSDLMNSYTWDTATLFLQTCGTNVTYSRQKRVSSTLSQTGTNTQSTKDVQCNVYDMASNVREWTTETSNNSNNPCVGRGGGYNDSTGFTSGRVYDFASYSYDYIGFRPILFI